MCLHLGNLIPCLGIFIIIGHVVGFFEIDGLPSPLLDLNDPILRRFEVSGFLERKLKFVLDHVAPRELFLRMYAFVWSCIPPTYGHVALHVFRQWCLHHIEPWPRSLLLPSVRTSPTLLTEQEGESLHASIERAIQYQSFRMGWYHTRPDQSFEYYVPLPQLSVRFGTSLQFSDHWSQIQVPRIQIFIRLALSLPLDAEISDNALSEVRTLFPRLWKLKLDNFLKETYWGLVYNALPIASRMRHDHEPIRQCHCMTGVCDRPHIFWSCPVAQSIIQEINSILPPSQSLTMSSLWLFRHSECPALHPYIFDCVVLAALHAMWSGSRSLYTFNQKSVRNPVQRACFSAKIKFYSMLVDIASVALFPRKLKKSLTPQSLFIFKDPDNDHVFHAIRPRPLP